MRNFMPELPEVEAFGKYFDKTSLHKKIKNFEVKSPEILQNVSEDKLNEKLEGHEFQFTKRYGKNLFAHLDNNFWLILHFGMTGNLKYFEKKDENPAYDRILINFDKGSLAFVDPRKFGKVNLASDMENFIKEKRLGVDALQVDYKTFKKLLEKRKGAIKTVLMNQHILAGIGNIYSDEILFQTCIHPKTRVNKLNDGQKEQIFETMKDVIETATRKNMKNQKLPDSFLIPHRVKNGKCPNSNMKLKTIKISGRTSYYCPECQKEIF